MPYTDRIKKPVSIYDVQQAIGLASNDLGTLCKSDRIRKWAKYRPIEYHPGGVNFVKVLTLANRASVNYGINNIPSWTNQLLGHMMYFWFGVNTSSTNYPDCGMQVSYWTRVLPSTVFRLSDFAANPSESTQLGYFPGAKPPIGNLVNSNLIITPNGHVTFQFAKNEEGVSAGLTIRYEDLKLANNNTMSLANMYFGVAIYKSGLTNPFYHQTQDTPMTDFQSMGSSVIVEMTQAQGNAWAGTVMVFPFISSEVQATLSNATNISGNHIALMEPELATLTIQYAKATVMNFYVWRDPSSSTRLVYYSFDLQNNEADVSRSYSAAITFLRSDGVTEIMTKTVTGTIAGGATINVDGSQDMSSYGGTSLVGAARVVVTITNSNVIFKQSSSATTNYIPDTPPIIN